MYRYESMRYSTCVDPELEIYRTSRAKLYLTTLFVTAETPKGVWVGYSHGSKDYWVSNTAKKRFAHPTKEEALENYRHRKKAYVRHSENRLRRAREDLELFYEEKIKHERTALENTHRGVLES